MGSRNERGERRGEEREIKRQRGVRVRVKVGMKTH